MKFAAWPLVKLNVGDQTLVFEQDNGSMYVGTSVWPCSLVLAKWAEQCCARGTLDLQGKRAIELGAGCGVAGMALSLLGLDLVVLTDVPPVTTALKRNLKKNSIATSLGKNGRKIKIQQLNWGNEKQMEKMGAPFDFVIAADVVYLENGVEPLLATMEELAGPQTVILLGYQVRSPEAHELFWKLCPERFLVTKVDKDDLHPDYAFGESDVYILTKKVSSE